MRWLLRLTPFRIPRRRLPPGDGAVSVYPGSVLFPLPTFLLAWPAGAGFSLFAGRIIGSSVALYFNFILTCLSLYCCSFFFSLSSFGPPGSRRRLAIPTRKEEKPRRFSRLDLWNGVDVERFAVTRRR